MKTPNPKFQITRRTADIGIGSRIFFGVLVADISPNDECPMTKEIRNPNDEDGTGGPVRTGLAFGLCHSLVIRISSLSNAA